jgi:hypothetical protein
MTELDVDLFVQQLVNSFGNVNGDEEVINQGEEEYPLENESNPTSSENEDDSDISEDTIQQKYKCKCGPRDSTNHSNRYKLCIIL